MRKLKGWITTTCLAAMIAASTLNANAGVIITGATSPAPTSCTEKAGKEKVDYAVIIAGVTAVIIAGFTGIIITGITTEPVEECAIIIAG